MSKVGTTHASITHCCNMTYCHATRSNTALSFIIPYFTSLIVLILILYFITLYLGMDELLSEPLSPSEESPRPAGIKGVAKQVNHDGGASKRRLTSSLRGLKAKATAKEENKEKKEEKKESKDEKKRKKSAVVEQTTKATTKDSKESAKESKMASKTATADSKSVDAEVVVLTKSQQEHAAKKASKAAAKDAAKTTSSSSSSKTSSKVSTTHNTPAANVLLNIASPVT